jgi:hypothetical protein
LGSTPDKRTIEHMFDRTAESRPHQPPEDENDGPGCGASQHQGTQRSAYGGETDTPRPDPGDTETAGSGDDTSSDRGSAAESDGEGASGAGDGAGDGTGTGEDDGSDWPDNWPDDWPGEGEWDDPCD